MGCVGPVCCYYQALRAQSHCGGRQSFPGIMFSLQAKSVRSIWDPYRPASCSESALFPFSHPGTFFIPSITRLCAEAWAGVAKMAIRSSGCVPEVGDCSLLSAPEGWVTATWREEVWLGHMRCSNAVWPMNKSCFPWKRNNDRAMPAIVSCPCSPRDTG